MDTVEIDVDDLMPSVIRIEQIVTRTAALLRVHDQVKEQKEITTWGGEEKRIFADRDERAGVGHWFCFRHFPLSLYRLPFAQLLSISLSLYLSLSLSLFLSARLAQLEKRIAELKSAHADAARDRREDTQRKTKIPRALRVSCFPPTPSHIPSVLTWCILQNRMTFFSRLERLRIGRVLIPLIEVAKPIPGTVQYDTSQGRYPGRSLIDCHVVLLLIWFDFIRLAERLKPYTIIRRWTVTYYDMGRYVWECDGKVEKEVYTEWSWVSMLVSMMWTRTDWWQEVLLRFLLEFWLFSYRL